MSEHEKSDKPENATDPGVSMDPQPTEAPMAPAPAPKRRPFVPIGIAIGVAVLLAGGYALYKRSTSKTNDVALTSEPKPVTFVEGRSTTFRPSRRYVAALDPWLSARVGPQLVAAYVDTVLYRPGAVVKKGDVLATLDCRNASAEAQSVAMAAKALETKQAAAAKESARITAMLDGGFVSQNEADKKLAESATQQAEILAAKAKLLGTSLEVNDCVLKAPFDGEVSDRFVDPGAFVRPGTSILGLVDRTTVRVAADVPETEFSLVSPGTSVKMRVMATGMTITAPITRRAPTADPGSRMVHFEIDLPDPARTMPVGTTVELFVDVGEPLPAVEIPLSAASVRGDKATVFVLEGDVAKKRVVPVLGESGGSLFLDGAMQGAKFVSEGRTLLNDNDKVVAKEGTFTASTNTGTTGSASPTSSSKSMEKPL